MLTHPLRLSRAPGRRLAVPAVVAAAVALVAAGSLAAVPVRARPQVQAQVQLSDREPTTTGAPAATGGSAYTIAATYGGKPVRWNACSAIHWTFRAAGAPASGLTVVKQSIAEIARDTGTTWVYDGTVTAVPSTSWLPTHAQTKGVLVGWTDGAHSDLLHGQAKGVRGVTRTSWVSTHGNGRIIGSAVALDRSDSLPMNGPGSWRTVVLHELSHAVGLGHATSSRELMYATLGHSLAGLQAGDKQGLAHVGRSSGCIS